MAEQDISRKLAVIVHADVAGSTALVRRDETLAHHRINAAFQRFSAIIEQYHGTVHEIRGDALVAGFARASDAVCAALGFQQANAEHNAQFDDDIVPVVRIGIALGEEVFAHDTVTGAGVVLAQRVERLSAPGGVCVTSAIHEAIPQRMPFDQESLGEQDLKGFDELVRVYRVTLKSGQAVPEAEASTQTQPSSQPRRVIIALTALALIIIGGVVVWFKPWAPEFEPVSEERMALPLPDKPSIAVLPFTNMSDDPKQEYFVDGMTEDLITDLSQLSGLFVIARNSVFTYKGKPVKVRQVAEELGVRYVLEGSVRRADSQVRINAQLIDATTGGHVWAARYDGSLEKVFTIQDEVTQKIVAALAVNLTTEEEATTQAQIETNNPEAYDAFLQGWEHYRRGTPDEFVKAISYFKEAIKWDPNYTRAHSALAAVYWNSYWNGWTRSLGLISVQAREQARLYQAKAMKAPSALTHQVAAEIAAFYRRRPDKALAEAERAIALDPNDPAGYLARATALIKAGRPAEAVEGVRTAMRLDPHYPDSYLTRLGQAQFALGQFQNAATTLERAATRNPDNDWTFVYLAAAYGQLGRKVNAKAAVDTANRLRAKAGWDALTLQTVGHWKWLGDRTRLREGLAKAGVETEHSDWIPLVTTRSTESWKDFIHEVKGVTTIDVATAKALYDRGVPFVDVYYRWPVGHVPGAYYLGHESGGRWGSLEFNEVRLLEIVDKTQEVVIYSSEGRAGRSAASACAKALTWGFEKVYYFAEGFPGWKAAGYPIERGG